MELYADMLEKILRETDGKTKIGRVKINANKVIEKRLYKLLKEIKEILEREELDDKECFERIEDIVVAYEKLGSGCGLRHDFS